MELCIYALNPSIPSTTYWIKVWYVVDLGMPSKHKLQVILPSASVKLFLWPHVVVGNYSDHGQWLAIAARPDKIDTNCVWHLLNEILTIIIRETWKTTVTTKPQAALACCRLASHLLCSLATAPFFHLYWRILVDRATKLNEILSIHNIAVSVRTLALHFYNFPTLRNYTCGTLMSAILHHLPHIQNFTLNVHAAGFYNSIPEDFASAIQALWRSPNLTTLYLENTEGFPFMEITACPNLRRLRLQDVRLWINSIF